MLTSPIARFISRVAADAEADDDLVRRFAAERCEAAFAELVRRHGPAVFGVCRRALGDHHLAEDAFQATFLVLARRAADVRPPDAVGGWLFGVARKVAAEAAGRQRRSREVSTAAPPDRPVDGGFPDDTAAVVEAAIATLPLPLRAAVLACEIQGLSRARAAVRLGIPEGTLSSRLAAARKLLGERLRSRVALAVAVPAALAAAAHARADGRASGTVLALTNEVLRVMITSRLNAVPLLVACLLAVVVGVVSAGPVRPPGGPVRQVKAPIPKPAAGDGRLFVWADDQPVFLNPDGTGAEKVPVVDSPATAGALSPDGKRLVWITRADGKRGVNTRAVGETEAKPLAEDVEPIRPPVWAADGRSVLVTGYERDSKGKWTEPLGVWAVGVADGKRAKADLPAGHVPLAVTTSAVLTQLMKADGPKVVPESYLIPAKDGKVSGDPAKLLGEGRLVFYPRLSPDGKRLGCVAVEYAQVEAVPGDGWLADREKGREHLVVDVRTGKSGAIAGIPDEASLYGLAWSPDGKRLGYVWYARLPPPKPGVARNPGPGEPTFTYHVVVCDPDGGNAKEVYSVEGSRFLAFDWR